MKIFLFLIKTICCEPSSEPFRRDGSDERSQHMVHAELTKLLLFITKYFLLCRTLF